MATSAVCVTGLTTQSLATELSLFGQLVILVLIQIGGLSIMTLYSSMTVMVGHSMGMKDKVIMQDLIGFSDLENIFTMIAKIIKYTFLIELGGAAILTAAFINEGFTFFNAFYYGIFHSISAFCNAGFTLFEKGLESYNTTPLIHGTIAALVTAGGLGFIVISELKQVLFRKKSLVRIGLHSKVVLITSAFLTLAGCMIIFFWEFLHALDQFTLWEKNTNSPVPIHYLENRRLQYHFPDRTQQLYSLRYDPVYVYRRQPGFPPQVVSKPPLSPFSSSPSSPP